MGRRFFASRRRRVVGLAAAVVLGTVAAAAYAALPSTTVQPSSVTVGTLAGATSLRVLSPASFLPATETGSNAVLQRLHFDDGQSTGWHTHPGPNIVLVVSGKFELLDEGCNVTFYGPGQGFATGTAVHEAIAIGATEFYSLYVLPPSASVLRTDASPPACATNGEDTPFLPAGVPVLHVHINPQAVGFVRSSSPSGYLVDCPLACARPVGAGTAVTLNAVASAGWVFSSWSGGPCDGQTTATCSFAMASAATTDVTANFKKSS